MQPTPFSSELALYGPNARVGPEVSLRESRRYCRRLARRHYENFSVASLLLPRNLRQHFHNIYAYCRWADDLADETSGPEESLKLLDWWQGQLQECYRGRTSHPVFVALAETIKRFEIPADPFAHLLVAFRQDQRTTSYETFDELLGYCRHSANPVGHLILYLGRCYDPRRAELSDSICTGLQLANFWQDVARDFDQGRIYLPQADCRRFGYDYQMFARREVNPAFRALLAHEVDRATAWLQRGLPLADILPRELRLDVSLFAHGGLAILERIRRLDYDVWSRRPTVGKLDKMCILAQSWWQLRSRHIEL